jgi:hypothetical protein
MVNGILGGLLRLHFPGMVRMSEDRYEPAWTWQHYHKAPDVLDRLDRCYASVADRVKAELWVSLSRTMRSIHRIHLTFLQF